MTYRLHQRPVVPVVLLLLDRLGDNLHDIFIFNS
jgi:hypothetical protein